MIKRGKIWVLFLMMSLVLLGMKSEAAEVSTIEVSFSDASSGTARVISKKNVVFGEAYGTLPSVTWTGHTFLGWYDIDTDGSKRKITAETKVTKESAHTLTAEWKINTYTIKIVKNGGKGVSSVAFSYGAVTKAPKLTSSTQKFLGWYTDSKGKKKFQFGQKMPAKNFTVYAKWLKVSALKKPSVKTGTSGADLTISIKKVPEAASYQYQISEDKSFKKNVLTINTSKTSIKISSKETEKQHIQNFSNQYVRVRAYLAVSDGKNTKKPGKFSTVKKTAVLKLKPAIKLKYNQKKQTYDINILNIGKAECITLFFGTGKAANAKADGKAELNLLELSQKGIKLSSLHHSYFSILRKDAASQKHYQIVYLRLSKGSSSSAVSNVEKIK